MYMMLVLHPLFIISSVLFWLNQALEKIYGIYIPIVHGYLDDLLCMPIVLSIAMQVVQMLHPLGSLYTFSRSHIFIVVFYFSLLFEVVLPLYSINYTADILDIGCYIIGAIVFYRIHVEPRKALIDRILTINVHKSMK